MQIKCRKKLRLESHTSGYGELLFLCSLPRQKNDINNNQEEAITDLTRELASGIAIYLR